LNIIDAYSLWDTFKLKDALHLFGKIKADGVLNAHPMNKSFTKNFSLLNGSTENKYSIYRLVDLLQNINRRMEEGKYDDAQARIYRLFEYMAQIKLYESHNKLETERIKISSLPETLRHKYEKMAGHKQEVQLSMVRVYELLEDLKDAMGVDFMSQYRQEESELRKLLNQRNKSILAHGFKAIEKEDCEKLMSIAQEFLNKYFPDWTREKDNAVFPKL
jgi:CRISPR-associated protein (TIGR02710 family)